MFSKRIEALHVYAQDAPVLADQGQLLAGL